MHYHQLQNMQNMFPFLQPGKVWGFQHFRKPQTSSVVVKFGIFSNQPRRNDPMPFRRFKQLHLNTVNSQMTWRWQLLFKGLQCIQLISTQDRAHDKTWMKLLDWKSKAKA